jgi:hypothetical protein
MVILFEYHSLMSNTRPFALTEGMEINHFPSPGKHHPCNVFKTAPGHAQHGITTREKHLDKPLFSR